MKFGIHANPNKPKALELARRAEQLIGGRAELVFSQDTVAALGEGARAGAPLEKLGADALIALGGDGTFLYTLQRVSEPLLPINAGTVGFLAEIDGDNLAAFDGAIDRLVRGLYFLEERMRIATQVDGVGFPDAVNEVVIHTAQVAKMRLFEILIDQKPVGRLRADGIIVATPTGSTSYALSAMGPIVEPTLDAIVLTALAPFQATQRAVIVEPMHTIGIRLLNPGKGGVVVVDGQSEQRIEGGSEVVCYRSPRKAAFVRFASRYFPKLHGKKVLPWGDEALGSEEDEHAAFPS